MSTLYCAVHESEIGPITTCCIAVADGRFRGKADSGTPQNLANRCR